MRKRQKARRGSGHLVEVEWVANMAGVSQTAFAKWRKANGYLSIKGDDRKHYVSWEAAKKYLEGDGAPRVDSAPAGWKPLAQIARESGLPERLMRKGVTLREVPVVRVKSTLLVEPRALVQWTLERLPKGLPKGWATATSLAKGLGVKSGTIRAFVHRHNLPHEHARLEGAPQVQMVLPPRVVRFITARAVKEIGSDEMGILDFGERFGELRDRFYYFAVDVSGIRTFKRRRGARVVRAARREDLEVLEGRFHEWVQNHSRRRKKGVRHAGGRGGEAHGEADPRGDRARVAHDDRPAPAEDQGFTRAADRGRRPPVRGGSEERRVYRVGGGD